MKNEMLTKLVKAGVAVAALLGITFAPEQVDEFGKALGVVVSGIFAVVYALEAWWKDRK